MKFKSILRNRFEIMNFTLELIKSLDLVLVSRGIYRFQFENQIYYLKLIFNKLEYTVGKELEKVNSKHFLIPICLLEENASDKNPIVNHIKNKNHYYIISKEMNGQELDQVIPKLTHDEFEILICKIIDSLEEGWEKIKFVHGDLHLRNIFVDESLNPIIFDFEHSSIYFRNPKKNFKNDLWIFLTNLALNVRNEKSEIVMKFVDKYFQERNTFQESLYACIPKL